MLLADFWAPGVWGEKEKEKVLVPWGFKPHPNFIVFCVVLIPMVGNKEAGELVPVTRIFFLIGFFFFFFFFCYNSFSILQ